MRPLTGVLLAGALAFSLAACGSSGSSKSSGSSSAAAGDSKKDIIIGAAIAKSGGFELYDNPQLAGMQYAVDQINTAGGINGQKLKIITADTKTDPAQIQSAAQDVLSKGADVVVTTPDYDFGAPAAIAATKAGKVSFGGAGAPEFAFQGLGSLHFNVYQGTPTEGVALATAAYKSGLKHPYLMVDTSIAYSTSLCEEFEKAWNILAGTGTITGKDSFKNSDPSVANQVTKVRAATTTDFVVMCSYPPGGASAIRQLRTGNVDLPIYGGSAFDGTFWTSAIPNLSNFYNVAMASSAGDDPNSAVNDFMKNVKFDGSASYALFGYEIIETLKYGLEKTGGKADGKTLAAAIETMKDQKLLVGPTTYSATCHAPIDRPLAIVKLTNGKAALANYVTTTAVPKTAC
jgi:branched-chain amino acid transport system substrate-binding protein